MGPAPEDLGPGRRITDRFEVESVLGRGAFGTTYLARDLFHRVRVVVKVFLEDTPEVRELVRVEAKVTKTLHHPNLRAVLDSGESSGKPFIAYEWIDGADLASVLQSGPLQMDQAITACHGIAGALSAAHAQGLIHRDLKPSNLLIPGWPQSPDFYAIRLVDFGVAGVLKPSTQKTHAGMIFGTPVYMSPEQLLGEPQTTATDVYALGLLLYEMLTGLKLREGTDPVAIFHSILYEPVSVPPSIPTHLADLIRGCLNRVPAARPTIERFTLSLSAASSPSRPARRPVWSAVAIGLALCAAMMLGALLLVRAPQPSAAAFPAVFGGAFLMALGISAGFWIRGRLNRSTSDLKSQALGLALDARQHVDVTATIALQVTDLVGRLRQVDQRILAGTVALMLNEYQTASEGKDRQSALMNVVALSEKLGQRLSPWYVRYKDVIATFVAVAGAVSGLLTAYAGLHHK